MFSVYYPAPRGLVKQIRTNIFDVPYNYLCYNLKFCLNGLKLKFLEWHVRYKPVYFVLIVVCAAKILNKLSELNKEKRRVTSNHVYSFFSVIEIKNPLDVEKCEMYVARLLS